MTTPASRRRRRTKRPASTLPPQPVLTIAEAHELAGALLRELSPLVGDQPALRAAMLRWLDEHDVARLGVICMAAVYVTFTSCLTPSPTPDPPPGALIYDQEGTT